MKKFFLLSLVAILFGNLSAQNVETTKFELDKRQVDGYTMSFIGKNADLVGSAFKSYLEKINGMKAGKGAAKGFSGYQKQILQPLSASASLDIYYKVEEGSKKDKTTRLYFSFSSFASGSEIVMIEGNSVKFLNDFVPYLSKYENEEKLKVAQSNLDKLKKEHEKLKKEKAGLEKDLKEKENSIVNKEKEINGAEAEIEKYKQLIGQ